MTDVCDFGGGAAGTYVTDPRTFSGYYFKSRRASLMDCVEATTVGLEPVARHASLEA